MAQTKIAGLFLDPTVISGLTALGSGGGAPAADYLFIWDATDSLLKKILPNHLGLAAAAHTIESHTATDATGANLDTLTGGSSTDADALHTHNAKASLSGAVFTGTVTTPSVLFKGSSNVLTMDVNNAVAAYTIKLPDAAPGAGEFLKATSGDITQLEWGAVTPAAITGTAGGADTYIAVYNTASTLDGSSALTYDGTVLTNTGSGAREIVNHLTATSGADSRMVVSIPASASNVAYIGFHEGAGDGTSNNMGYRMGYDASANYFRIQSRDLNGSGGAGNVLEIPDGAANIKVTAGNLVIGTAGKGIDFSITNNASQSGSTMANELLDDYEEGTWSPEVWGNSNNDGSTGYTTQYGSYVKIGNHVFFSAYFQINGSGLAGIVTTQYAKIGNLPFTAVSTSNSYASVHFGYMYGLYEQHNADTTHLAGYVAPGENYISVKVYHQTNSVLTPQCAIFAANVQIMLSGHYQTAT